MEELETLENDVWHITYWCNICQSETQCYIPSRALKQRPTIPPVKRLLRRKEAQLENESGSA
jgi:hypothetical protein